MNDNRTRKNVCRLLALALLCLAGGACGSDNDSASLPGVPANPDALCTLIPRSIAISATDAQAPPLVTRSATTGKPEQQETYAANLGGKGSIEATLEAAPEDARTRAAGSLVAGAQYRIVVYDGAGEIKGNVVYKQGSTDIVSGEEIKLKAGTYRLFCYTFNSSDAIRDLDADKKNVTVNSGEDFMTYTDAAFTIAAADYASGKALNISFVRQCARLTVTVKADGYTDNIITFASMTVGNVFGSGSRQWNGTTNTDASILPYVAGTASLVKASANGASVDCGPSADNPYLITAPCTNQTISVSGLFMDRTGQGVDFLDFNFFNPVTLAKGGSYKLTLYIGTYYVLTRHNPVTIGGVKWARTNLKQTGSGVYAPVSFVDNPWDYGNYWKWGRRDATADGDKLPGFEAYWDISTVGHINQDPCRSLGSGWRLPNDMKGELESLVNNVAPKGTRVKINGAINTIGDFGYAPDAKGGVFISGNQVVFLPAGGMYEDDKHWSVDSGMYWFTYRTSSGECTLISIGPDYVGGWIYLDGYRLLLRCVQE